MVGFGRQGAHLDVCDVTVERLAVARSVVEIATVQSPFNLADTSRADRPAHTLDPEHMARRDPNRTRISGHIGDLVASNRMASRANQAICSYF